MRATRIVSVRAARGVFSLLFGLLQILSSSESFGILHAASLLSIATNTPNTNLIQSAPKMHACVRTLFLSPSVLSSPLSSLLSPLPSLLSPLSYLSVCLLPFLSAILPLPRPLASSLGPLLSGSLRSKLCGVRAENKYPSKAP